jgi:hypothetical protein
MIHEAVTDIKTLFSDMDIIDLDVGKEINTHGNYLVFDSFKPDGIMNAGAFNFTLYMALKSLKRANENAYADLDDIITAIGDAPSKEIVCECRGIELNQFGERLFIYAVKLEITRSW